MNRYRILFVMTVLAIVAFCLYTQFRGNPNRGIVGTEQKASTDFDASKSILATVLKEDTFTLFEGLPHQGNERSLLEEEMKAKETVRIRGFPFYRTPLELAAADRDILKAWLGSVSSFRAWMGEKKCGGFHPDYGVTYRVGEAKYDVLICFGCHEIVVFGLEGSLRCDMNRDAFGAIEEMLKAFRKNRPARVPAE